MEPQQENEHWERLYGVIRWSNMTTNHFAQHIGLANGENLYRVKRGQNKISRRLAETIVTTFPDVNAVWLLTGHGTMLTSEATQSRQIDFYDRDAEQWIGQIEELEPRSIIILPDMVEADLAMLYMGDMMGEVTPANTIVMLQRVDLDTLIFGKEYLVVGEKSAILRLVRSSEQRDQVRLRAALNEKYDDIIVDLSSIKSIYRVVAKVINS